MKTAILLASVANMFPAAFMSDTCEVVNVRVDGNVIRVNKSDYIADQAEDGAKSMTLVKRGEDADAEQSVGGVTIGAGYPDGMDPVAAPSAPDFTGTTPPPETLDPVKNAVAPAAPSPGSFLVSKEGEGKKAKYFVVDATGAKIERDGIDHENGYSTEQAAWRATLDLPR